MASGAVFGILGGGKTVQSGTVTSSSGTITFPKPFSKTPKVLVQIASWNGGNYYYFDGCYASSITTDGFKITLDITTMGRGTSISGTFDWCAYEE